jgi:ribosomal protein S18 acetylase RimI-like enzyme
MRLRELENAAALAWPAPVRPQCCGFELRLSKERSNRGNSARLLGRESSELTDILRCGRRFYAEAGKALQFSVTDQMPVTDDALERCGFELIDPCNFMVRATAGVDPPRLDPSLALTTSERLDDRWLAAWALCAEMPEPDREGSFAIVRSVSEPSVYVSVTSSSHGSVAIGRAVDSGNWRGLHNLATHPEFRGAGIGSAVVRALETARDGAAKSLYLQVEADSPAGSLYERLGYRIAGGYHYRRDGADGA